MNRSPSGSLGNRSPSNSLLLRKAITGFLNFKTAAGLSQRSVDSYERILEQWADYAGDRKVSQFTDHDINEYLVYMRTECVPQRFGSDTRALSSNLFEISGSRYVRSSRGHTPSSR